MYGNYGRPILLFEAYREWRDHQFELVEAGELEEADMRADFPSWLWGPVRRSVWQGYTRIEPQWEKYVRTESMPDFRPRLIHGLNSIKGFGYVGEGGEYPGMRRSERGGPSLTVDTYGGVYDITRHAIINDESGDLLNRVPNDMGYEAAVFVAEAIVALIESNPTAYDGVAMFQAAGAGQRGNQVTLALSEDALADAMTFMESMLDDDGYRIRIKVGSVLIKTFRQELIVRRILNSTVTIASAPYTAAAPATAAVAGTAVFDKGNINPLQGVLSGDQIVRESFLSDANDWYMFADPGDVPAFAAGFLNGQQKPFVGIKDPNVRNALGAGMDPYDFEFDTVAFKIRHEFGIAAVDPRGCYRAVVS